jgi:hypothetical protein
MAALHSLSLQLEPDADPSIQFKSPDYQKTILQFRESIGEMPDYEKILLFLGFEKVAPDEMYDLTGIGPDNRKNSKERVKKSFIPYIKEKLIWS